MTTLALLVLAPALSVWLMWEREGRLDAEHRFTVASMQRDLSRTAAARPQRRIQPVSRRRLQELTAPVVSQRALPAGDSVRMFGDRWPEPPSDPARRSVVALPYNAATTTPIPVIPVTGVGRTTHRPGPAGSFDGVGIRESRDREARAGSFQLSARKSSRMPADHPNRVRHGWRWPTVRLPHWPGHPPVGDAA